MGMNCRMNLLSCSNWCISSSTTVISLTQECNRCIFMAKWLKVSRSVKKFPEPSVTNLHPILKRILRSQFCFTISAQDALWNHFWVSFKARYLSSKVSQQQSSKYWSKALTTTVHSCQLLIIYIFGVQKGIRCQRIARDWSGRSVLLARSTRLASEESAPTSFLKSTVPLYRVKGLRATERLENSSERLAPGVLRWVLIYLLWLCFRLLPHVPHSRIALNSFS